MEYRGGSRKVAKSLQESIIIAFDFIWKILLFDKNFVILLDRGLSRISGLRNNSNKRTLYKERKINKRGIHFLSKQNIKAPLILDMYV